MPVPQIFSPLNPQEVWLVHNFQPNLASKALFWNSIVLIPSPPMDLGVQMLLQARRVRLCLLYWGKPYQSFLKLESISWHSFWEKEEGHGVGGNCIGNCFHESSSPWLRKEFCLPTRESIQKFGFEIFKGKLFVLANEEWDSKVFGLGGDLARIKNGLDGCGGGGEVIAILADKQSWFSEIDLLARPIGIFF